MASRRFRSQKRGRPKKAPNRDRRPAPDYGTTELRSKKLATVRRVDLELTGIDILFGRGLIDAEQRDQLGEVAELLRILARHLGPKPNATSALWTAILGAALRGGNAGMPSSVGPAADYARFRLERICRRLDGSRALIIALAEDRRPPLIVHILAGRLDDQDLDDLERLRSGLDALGRR